MVRGQPNSGERGGAEAVSLGGDAGYPYRSANRKWIGIVGNEMGIDVHKIISLQIFSP